MRIKFAKTFEKQIVKQPVKIREKFYERLEIFTNDPSNPQLKNHSLLGEYKGYYSINITGDVRALYRKEGEEIVIFAFIGTHSQLY